MQNQRWLLLCVSLNLGTFAPLRAAITDGLVGHWTFDQTNGLVAADATANGNHGALNGFPSDNSQWVTGRIGGAVQFGGPGSGDYIRVPNYSKPTTGMTVSAWVWADARPSWASIAKNWGGTAAGQFHFGLQDTGGDLSNFIRTQGGATPNTRENSPIPLGSWQHVAFTADGATMSLYRNGSLVNSAAYSGNLAAPPMAALGIGVKLNDAGTAPDSNTPGFWQGKMDDLGIWNRPLSLGEILAIYGAGLESRSLTNAEAPPSGGGGVAITEFMASNTGALRDEDGDTPDWIEIHNGTAAPVNLGGWSLTDTTNNLRKWIFPATNLAAGSYLIVFASGKNRATTGAELHANFSLAAGGEYLGLIDARTNVVSQFTLFPPQVANVSYGFARLAPPQSFITNGSPLRYLVPMDGSLGTNWIFPGFNDTDWSPGANAVGYETVPESYAGLFRTDVRDLMFNRASSCYIRIPFVVTNAAAFNDWTLRLQADDGVVIWLNGEEVVRYFAPETVTWNSFATLSRVDSDVLPGELFNLAEFENLIVTGTNLLTLHALNGRLDSGDLLINPLLDAKSTSELAGSQRYFTLATPGTPNLGGVEVLGPIITELRHSPEVPAGPQDLIVTARVAPAIGPVTNVTLRYRVMFGGEVALEMFDDGAHGDGTAGDRLYGATIPASAATSGQMVRYYVTALDNEGRQGRAPLFLDPLGAPEYQGTVIPDPSISTPLPVFHWFVQNPAAAETATGTRSSLFYNGEFYDNIFVRLRGGTSRSAPKKSYKVEFNEGFHFRLRDELPRMSEFDWNTTYTDKSYNRKVIAYEGYRDAGHPVIETFHAHLRQNGAFYSVTLWTEQPDRDFLRRWGLDAEGALYKAGFNGGAGANYETVSAFEKKTRKTEGTADLQALINGLALPGSALESFIFDNADIPAMVNVTAIVCMQQNIDASDKNHYVYRDTRGTREWRFLPWDLDLTFGPNALNTDTIVYNEQDITIPRATSHPFIGARPYMLHAGKYNRFIEAIVNTARTREMLLRRIRTLTEEQLTSGYYARRIDELVSLLAADVAADRARWGASAHFGGVAYSFQAANDRIKYEYLAPRIGYLTGNTIVNVGTANPGPQPWFVDVQISSVEVNPSSGVQTQEYICITNSNPFAVDLTGWRLRGDVEFDFRPATVMPARSVMYLSPDVVEFRARTEGPRGGQGLFVQGNYRGNLGARGGALRLIDQWGREPHGITIPAAPSLAQQFLRVTELMYHPAPLTENTNEAEAFEYIELKNISATEALDLADVRFINGIQFNFTASSVTTLAPGASVVIVRNLAAFAQRYGGGLAVAGQYTGNLDNGGERLRLIDASGEEILDFEYNDNWYPITDGLGFSLVIRDAGAPFNTWSRKESWRPASALGGSPGGNDPAPPLIAPIVINEALTRTDVPPPTDSVELFNPTAASVNLGGWFLSDDVGTPKKFRIPNGTTIPGFGFVVFTEDDFGPGDAGFALSSDGDEVWLFSADANTNLTGYAQGFRFGAADDGVSFGRYTTSLGENHFVPQGLATLSAPNSGPRVGPVIISEIMYHPPEFGANNNSADEFVELLNTSGLAVPLYDPLVPVNTWKLAGGVEFAFPPNQSLAAGEYALVVPFDPTSAPDRLASFREKFGVGSSIKVWGPYRGSLGNAGDELTLSKPTTAVGGEIPFVSLEEIDYSDESPWPGADGDGTSLQRRNPNAYANDPINWAAAAPSAGRAYSGGQSPNITTQPASRTVVAFQSVTFSVTGAGTPPLAYQWRHNGANVAGGTSASLLITNVQPQDYGEYNVVVFNASGVAVSSNALLNIAVPPTITSQPQSQTVLAGASVTFTVAASGAGTLTYQWRYHGTNVNGATGTSFTITNVTAAHSGIVTVLVTDDNGFRESVPAVLTVLDPPFITLPPAPAYQEVPQGSTFRILVAATGTAPLSYKWRRNNITIINQTNAMLRITNAASSHAGSYSVIITNLAGAVTGGVAVVVYQADNDRDGMADNWERRYGLQTNDFFDAALDLDGDRMSNLAEYIAGTNPADLLSYLKIEDVMVTGPAATIRFFAVSNRTYGVLHRSALQAGPWVQVANTPPRITNRTEVILDFPSTSDGFYRLVIPAADSIGPEFPQTSR